MGFAEAEPYRRAEDDFHAIGQQHRPRNSLSVNDDFSSQRFQDVPFLVTYEFRMPARNICLNRHIDFRSSRRLADYYLFAQSNQIATDRVDPEHKAEGLFRVGIGTGNALGVGWRRCPAPVLCLHQPPRISAPSATSKDIPGLCSRTACDFSLPGSIWRSM